MALGSFVHGALAELTVDDLTRMLELDETLFVEHKSDLHPDHSYNLASTVASFANTLVGWLLLGVHDGKPVAEPGSWFDPSGPPLVDVVRDRLRMEIDPLSAERQSSPNRRVIRRRSRPSRRQRPGRRASSPSACSRFAA